MAASVGIGGDALVVDQRTGQVSLPTGAVSSEVESDPAPTLGADLDVNGFKIVGDRTAGTGLAIAADGKATFDEDVNLDSTGALKVPVGTTAQQPGTPATGMFRFNC